jgi:hypothetical protein
MIKRINGIDNIFLKKNYLEMVDSMFEHVVDINKGFGKNISKKAKRVSLVDPNTFNFFGMYSKEIYSIYKEISISVKNILSEENINFERSFPYLYGKVINNKNIPQSVPLNFAPNFRTTFWGLYIISSSNDRIVVEDNDINMEPSSLIIFNSSTKAVFNNLSDDFMAVVINISPLEYLHRQYYQKWMPLI